MPPPRINATEDNMDVLQSASERNRARIAESLQNTVKMLESSRIQRELQEQDDSLLSQVPLLGATDVARDLVGGVNLGIGKMVEGIGYGTGKLVGAEPDNFVERAGQYLQDRGNDVLEIRDAETLSDIATSTPSGDLFDPSTYSLGENPSFSGYAHQFLGILGEFAPQAVGLLAKTPQVAVALSGLTGAAQGGISQGNDARDYVNGLSDEELEKDSDLYTDLLSQGLSPDKARAQVAETAKAFAFSVGGGIAGVGGVATGYILRGLGKVGGSATSNIVGKTALSGAEEAAQEVGETVGSRLAANLATGTERSLTADTVADLVLGGGFGAALGGGTATVQATKGKIKEQTTDKLKAREAENVAIVDEIKSGDFSELVKPENRDKFPLAKVVKTLATVAQDTSDTPEVRKKAAEALVTVESEINQKIDDLNKIRTNEGASPEVAKIDEQIAKISGVITEAQNKITEIEETEGFDLNRIAAIEEIIDSQQVLLDEANESREALINTPAIKGIEKEIGVLQGQISAISAARKIASEAVAEAPAQESNPIVDQAIKNPETLSTELLEKVDKREVPQQYKPYISEITNAKIKENALRELDQFKGSILKDNARTGDSSVGKMSARIATAIANNNTSEAQAGIRNLKAVGVKHANKLQQAKIAFGKAKNNKSKFGLVYDRKRQTWVHRASKSGNFVNEAYVQANDGLIIDSTSQGVIDTLSAELDVLRTTYKAMTTLVNTTAIQQPDIVLANPPVQSDGTTIEATLETLDAKLNSAEGVTVDEIMQFIDANGTPVQQGMAFKFSNHSLIKKLGNIKTHNETVEYAGQSYVPPGYFSSVDGVTTVGINVRNPDGTTNSAHDLIDIILHEFTHVVSADEIEKGGDFANDIAEVNKEINEWLDVPENLAKVSNIDSADKLRYAAQNNHELLATFLGSPRLLKDLALIPSKKGANVVDRFFTIIKNKIASVLGLNTNEVTLMDRVLALSEQIFQEVPVTNQSYNFESIVQADVTNTENDLYSLNRLKAYFTNSKSTPISQVASFTDTVLRPAIDNLSLLAPYTNGGQSRLDRFASKGFPVRYLTALNNHVVAWDKKIDKLFRPKETRFAWQAPLNAFLNEDGVIDPAIKEAISVAAFDFIASNHNDLYFNTTESAIRSALNLDPNEDIPAGAANEIFDKGTRDNKVILDMGRAAYQISGLKLKKDAPINEEQLIQGALGNMALALLLDTKYVQRTQLKTEGYEKHFFIRSNRNPDASENPKLAALKDVAKGSQNILNDIYGFDTHKILPTLQPVKSKQKFASRSKNKVTRQQQNLINKANAKEYRLSPELLGEHGVLHRVSRDLLERVVGVNFSNDIHIENKLSVQGKNEALRRELDLLFDDHLEGILDGDVNKPFYIQHRVWKQFRVGQDSATVNPQNSKLHRAVTTIGNWSYEVDLNTGENLETFKLSVLEAIGKTTDNNIPSEVVKQFNKIMDDADTAQAVDVFKDMLKDDNYLTTKLDEEIIADAVAGKENMHTFTGLLALAKYELAKEGNGKFTSDLMREGDGKTNGPMIALLSMGMGPSFKRNAQLAAMGGFFTDKSSYKGYADYAGDTGLDLYKHVAKRMASIMKESLDNTDFKADYNALTQIMGDITADQGRNKDARNSVKKPITTVIFGSGMDSAIDDMANIFIEKFIAKVEGFGEDLDALDDFIAIVNAGIVNKANHFPRNTPLLSTYLTPGQKEGLKSIFLGTMGEALSQAIEIEFADLLETRGNLNEAVNMSARMYQAAYIAKKREIQIAGGVAAERFEALDRMKAEIKDPNHKRTRLPRTFIPDLSRNQQQQLDTELANMFPSIHTYFSKQAKDELGGIAGLKTKQVNSLNNAYRGETDFNNLRVFDGQQVSQVQSLDFAGLETIDTEPGVGLPIMLIHALDSYAAMAAYGNMNALNNHDAVTTGATMIAEGTKRMNEALFDGLQNYSIPNEIVDTFQRVVTEFAKIKSNDPDFIEAKANVKGKKFKGKTMREIYGVLRNTANVATKNKEEFLSHVVNVEQYYVENGGYEPNQPTKRNTPLLRDKDVKLGAPPNNSNAVTDFTTGEVLESLLNSDPVAPNKGDRLKSLLSNMVTKLHGPLGANVDLIRARAGETPNALYNRGLVNGHLPFASRVGNLGLRLTSGEMFVLEQIEITVQQSLDGSSFADKELVRLYQTVRAKATDADFHNGDWSKATPRQKERAKEIKDFIFEVNKDLDNGKSDHLSRFLALSQIYQPLIDLMDYHLDTDTGPKSDKAGDIARNIFDRTVQKMSDIVNGTYSNQKLNERARVTLERLVHNEHKRRLEINRGPSVLESQLEQLTTGVSQAVTDSVVRIAQRPMFRENRFILVKVLSELTEDVARDRVVKVFEALEDNRNDFLKNKPFGFAMNVFNEMRGEQDNTSQFFDLLGEATKIAQERKLFLDTINKEVLAQFKNGEELSDQVKSNITQVFLRNDLSSLLDNYSIPEIIKFVTSASTRDKRINAIRDELEGHEFGKQYINGSLELGYHLATGKNISLHLYLNAHNIARQSGLDANITEEAALEVEPLIDELVSLYALQNTPAGKISNLSEVFRDTSAIEYILRMHRSLRDDALKTLFDGNPTLMGKGYIKEALNPHNTVHVAAYSMRDQLESEGYEFISRLPLDPTEVTLGTNESSQAMYVLRDVGLARYETGIYSNTGRQARGTKLHGITTVSDAQHTRDWKARRVSGFLSERKNKLAHQRMYDRGYVPTDETSKKPKPSSLMAPVFNAAGEVANYRYLMNNETKDKLLDRDTRVENVLAGITANQYDKKASAELNKDTTRALKEFYDADYLNNPNAYVEFSPNSTDETLRTAYRLLPEATKREIARLWDGKPMLVRNDLLNMLIGYRNISISDPFGRDQNTRNVVQNFLIGFAEILLGKSAAVKLQRAENIWQKFVQLTKDIVVIRNVSTLLGNIASNTTLLFFNKVTIKEQISLGREAIDGILQYQEIVAKKVALEARIKGTADSNPEKAKIQDRIARLQHSLERNPVHNLVDAGLFQSIIDDVDVDSGEDNFTDAFDRTIEKGLSKLNPTVRKVGETLAVGKNTPLYKMLAKSTQMSDFVARYTLYEHMNRDSRNTMTDAEKLKIVRETFVNYEIPTDRKLQYANNLGLIMFTKYFLRTQKIIFRLMKDNPGRAMSLALLNRYVSEMPNILDSSMIGRLGNNPLSDGAFQILGAADEPLPINVIMGLWD